MNACCGSTDRASNSEIPKAPESNSDYSSLVKDPYLIDVAYYSVFVAHQADGTSEFAERAFTNS